MTHTKATVLINREPRFDDIEHWHIRIPKPRVTWGRLARAALTTLLLSYSVTLTALAHGAESDSAHEAACGDYAALHYEMSGGQDAAYEDAYAACQADLTYTDYISSEVRP